MIILIIIIILLLIIIILRQLRSFHCNCFVCSMLDLIYSSSILINSCRCLPGQKKENYYFLFSEKKICFLKMTKTLRKTPDFPWCSAKRKRGHIKTTSSFGRPSR